MNNTPVMYSPDEMEKLQNYITTTFGTPGDYLAHEMTSEYVHTDVQICHDQDIRHLVTFGMSARAMQAPLPSLQKTELVISVSDSFDLMSREGAVLLGELTGLTKFPFRKDTWLGHGHTVPASKEFREVFGYDCWLFMEFLRDPFVNVGGDAVHFLQAIPIYNAEREWIMENDGNLFFHAVYDNVGEAAVLTDSRREVYIPGDDAQEAALLSVLGTDYDTLQELCGFLEEMEQKGCEVDYDTIAAWLEEYNG